MRFYPIEAKVPDRLDHAEFFLQPLRATHVELDYAAVMEKPAALRAWSQSSWPSDGFTLAENLDDLVRHEREHTERSAFTFTVLSVREERCLGCVYITPFGHRIAAEVVPPDNLPGPDEHTADVCFWVRPSLFSNGIDLSLLQSLLRWFETDWQFDQLFYHTSQADLRQQQIYAQLGFNPIALFQAVEPRPGRWLLYKQPG